MQNNAARFGAINAFGLAAAMCAGSVRGWIAE